MQVAQRTVGTISNAAYERPAKSAPGKARAETGLGIRRGEQRCMAWIVVATFEAYLRDSTLVTLGILPWCVAFMKPENALYHSRNFVVGQWRTATYSIPRQQ